MRKDLLRLLAVMFLIVFIACEKENTEDPIPSDVTNYADASNWLLNPGGVAEKTVDVFFLYPTTYSGEAEFCAVTDAGMREGAMVVRHKNASVFEMSANLYMPYYRQANAGKLLFLPLDEQDQKMRSVPAVDGLAAFKYYMEHYNNGRPFMLAGHSQGSNVLLYILEYLKDHPVIQKQMIAAYVIGYSVTSDYLAANPHLKFAEGRTDTGVIISWNTEAPDVTEMNPVVTPGALAINPINWKRDQTYASKEESLGSCIYENNELVVYPHYADAQVDPDRNVIVCTTDIESAASSLFPAGVLHGWDYPLYYNDLKQNIADRIAAYFESI